MVIFLWLLTVLNLNQVNNPKDFYWELRERGYNKQIATIFTQVSIQEAGWNYESEIAKQNNNILGFICTSNSECNYGHMKFVDKYKCIDYLEWWIAYYPPKPGQNLYVWLRERGYNTNPNYYQKLKLIKFHYE